MAKNDVLFHQVKELRYDLPSMNHPYPSINILSGSGVKVVSLMIQAKKIVDEILSITTGVVSYTSLAGAQ